MFKFKTILVAIAILGGLAAPNVARAIETQATISGSASLAAGLRLEIGYDYGTASVVGSFSDVDLGDYSLEPYTDYQATFECSSNGLEDFAIRFDLPDNFAMTFNGQLADAYYGHRDDFFLSETIVIRIVDKGNLTQPLGVKLIRGSTIGSLGFSATLAGLTLDTASSSLVGYANVTPGKNYILSGSYSGPGQFHNGDIEFAHSSEYDVFVDGRKVRRIDLSDVSSFQYSIVMLPRGSSGGAYGSLLGASIEPVSWSVGLGSLFNGQSAGSLGFLLEDEDADLSEGLIFSDIQHDVEILYEQLVPRQIKTKQMILDIVENSGDSIALDYYPASSIGAFDENLELYAISGSPLVSFDFEDLGSGDYRLTRHEGARSQAYEFEYLGSGSYSLAYPGSVKVVERNQTEFTSDHETATVSIKRLDGTTDHQTTKTHSFFDFGKRLTETRIDVGGTDYVSTIDYYDSWSWDYSNNEWSGDISSYGQVKSVESYGGAWQSFNYSNGSGRHGLVESVTTRYLDVGETTRVFDYQSSWDGSESLLSNVSQAAPIPQDFDRSHQYDDTANGQPLDHIASSDFTGTDYQQSDVEYFRHHLWDTEFVELPYSASGPDGRKVSYLYQTGRYDAQAGSFDPDGVLSGDPPYLIKEDTDYITHEDEEFMSFRVQEDGLLHVFHEGSVDMESRLEDPDGNVLDDDGSGSFDYELSIDGVHGYYRIYAWGDDPDDEGSITFKAELTPYASGGEYWAESRIHGWSGDISDPSYAYDIDVSGSESHDNYPETEADYGLLTDGGYQSSGGYGSDEDGRNYLRADLGEPKYVDSVTIGGGDIDGWGNFNVDDVELQYSNSGNSWTTVETYDNLDHDQLIVEEVGVVARFWRLYRDDGYLGVTEFGLHGEGAPSQTELSVLDNQDLSPITLVPLKSFKEVSIRDRAGYIVRSEVHVFTGGSASDPQFELLSWNDISRDAKGQITRIEKSDGSILEWEYADGLMTASIGSTGKRTEYQHDALGRVTTVTKKGAPAYDGYAAQDDIVIDYVYNALDQILSKTVTAGSSSNVSTWEYDIMGRVTQETRPPGLVTSWDYSKDPDSGMIVTVTLPNGATKTTKRYKDGSVKEVTGDAVIDQYYTQDGDTSTVNYATPESDRLSEVTFDSLYRAKGVAGSSRLPMESHYDVHGRLIASVPDDSRVSGAPVRGTKYEYNMFGELYRTGMIRDHEVDESLSLANTHNLQEFQSGLEKIGSDWWNVRETMVYPEDGSPGKVTTSTVKTRVTGFANGIVSETHSIDIHGNATVSTVTVDRANRIVASVTDHPGSTIDSEKISYNGRTVEKTSRQGHLTTYGRDSFGRVIETNREDVGTYLQSWCACGRLEWKEDPQGNRTTYQYDSAGRLVSKIGPTGKTKTYTYNSRNQIATIGGDVPHPRTYYYNDYGQMIRIAANGNTFWDYDPATGLLLGKRDHHNKGQTHEYDEAFRRVKTTNARGIEVSYVHDGFGGIESIGYSDGTPGIDIQRNRIGLITSLTDSAGQRDFAYDYETLQLRHEQLSDSFDDRRITASYSSSGPMLGRSTGFSLGVDGDIGRDYLTSYAYDSFGRLASVAGPSSSSGSRTFQYGYQSVSNKVATIAEAASGYLRQNAYDPNRGLLTSIESKLGSETLARFDYRYDALSRRKDVAKSGRMYDLYGPDGLVERYTYNDRNELVGAHTFVGSDPEDLALPALPGRAYEYVFDDHGNRTGENDTGKASLAESIANDSLNQIVNLETKSVTVSGSTEAGASVAVSIDGAPAIEAGQQGDYWSATLQPDNANAYLATLDVYAGKDGEVRHEQRQAYVGEDEEHGIDHDNDGNTTSDGRWTYSWDANNRLIEMEAVNLFEDPRKKLAYDYDYMGRRWRKRVFERQGSDWIEVLNIKYVYSSGGWNLIAELDGLNGDAVIRSFTWGKDGNESVGGKGGVGGLLMVTEGSDEYIASYDGNGNLMCLTDASDGQTVAAYEYSPFGKLLRVEGAKALDEPFRFSTKYQDNETGLLYYGLRYYSPDRGRWINRDPIQERGGLNLYVFVGNDPINKIDMLGQYPVESWSDYDPEDPDAVFELDTFVVYAKDDDDDYYYDDLEDEMPEEVVEDDGGDDGGSGSSGESDDVVDLGVFVVNADEELQLPAKAPVHPFLSDILDEIGEDQKEKWSDEKCAELAALIGTTAESLLEINAMSEHYAQKLSDQLGRLGPFLGITVNAGLSTSSGLLSAANAVIEHSNQQRGYSNGLGQTILTTPSSARAPIMTEGAAKVVGKISKVTGVVGVGFTAYDAFLNDDISGYDRFVAGVDTAIGAAVLYPKDPFSEAVVGAAGAGYFAGRALGDTIDAGMGIYNDWDAKSEADKVLKDGEALFEERLDLYNSHCK